MLAGVDEDVEKVVWMPAVSFNEALPKLGDAVAGEE